MQIIVLDLNYQSFDLFVIIYITLYTGIIFNIYMNYMECIHGQLLINY